MSLKQIWLNQQKEAREKQAFNDKLKALKNRVLKKRRKKIPSNKNIKGVWKFPYIVNMNTTATKTNPTKRDNRGVLIKRSIKRSIQGNSLNLFKNKYNLGGLNRRDLSTY